MLNKARRAKTNNDTCYGLVLGDSQPHKQHLKVRKFKPPRLLCISCDPAGAMSHSTGPTTSPTLNPIVSSRFMRNLDLGVSHMTYLIHSGTEVGN